MKGLSALALCVIITMSLTVGARAEEGQQSLGESFGISQVEDALPTEARDVLGHISVTDSGDYDGYLDKLLSYASDILASGLKGAVKNAAVILIVVLIGAAANVFVDGDVSQWTDMGCALAIAGASAGSVTSFLKTGSETLMTLSDFSKALMPCLASAATASGAVTSGAAKYVASALFMDILITAANNIVIPLIAIYSITITASAAMQNAALDSAARLMKWLCSTALILLMLAFTAYLAITGIISGSADAVATRAAKTLISSALPVVGSIISDATGTFLAGAATIRNAIGVFGMLAVLAVCISPFITMGTNYLVYKATAALAGSISNSRISALISGFSSALGMILSLVGGGALMLMVSAISCMKAVGMA